ncbi:MAG: DinB family protein [Acidobacteria bacterium]|nr:DinB family protein [Acidobacteriota bacterium]
MPLHVLNPAAGFSPGIGFFVSGMDEVREQLQQAVEGMTNQELGRRAVPGAHSIAALVLHIGEAEWWWMRCNVSGHKLTPKDRQAPYWDVLKDPDSFASKHYSAKFCLDEIAKIRNQTRDLLASFNDDDLERIISFERRDERHEHSLRWILHHLIDHESQHKGQILMLKRLIAG